MCVCKNARESQAHTKNQTRWKKNWKIKKENAHTSKVWLKKEQETQTPLTKKKDETKKNTEQQQRESITSAPAVTIK